MNKYEPQQGPSWLHQQVIRTPEDVGNSYVVMLGHPEQAGGDVISISKEQLGKYVPQVGDTISSYMIPSTETQTGRLLLARTLGEQMLFDRRETENNQ